MGFNTFTYTSNIDFNIRDIVVKIFILISLLFINLLNLTAQSINIQWKCAPIKGRIECVNGSVKSLSSSDKTAKIIDKAFELKDGSNANIELEFYNTNIEAGPKGTIVHVKTNTNSFSFFLRDVNASTPIYIPEYSVAVTTSSDKRTYSSIASLIENKKLLTRFERIENEPEESFDNAIKHTRNQNCPSWLGLSRDMRVFEVADGLGPVFGEMNWVLPKRANSKIWFSQNKNKPYIYYGYDIGRGQGTSDDINRFLEDGSMPIIHTIKNDEDIVYHSTFFVSYEKTALTAESLKGTHYLVLR